MEKRKAFQFWRLLNEEFYFEITMFWKHLKLLYWWSVLLESSSHNLEKASSRKIAPLGLISFVIYFPVYTT